jgi:hypothetical protein
MVKVSIFKLYIRLGTVLAAFAVYFSTRTFLDTIYLVTDLQEGTRSKNFNIFLSVVKLLNSFADKLVWFVLYYFIFEAKYLCLKLECNTNQEYLKRCISTKRKMTVTLILLAVYTVTVLTCHSL